MDVMIAIKEIFLSYGPFIVLLNVVILGIQLFSTKERFRYRRLLVLGSTLVLLGVFLIAYLPSRMDNICPDEWFKYFEDIHVYCLILGFINITLFDFVYYRQLKNN